MEIQGMLQISLCVLMLLSACRSASLPPSLGSAPQHNPQYRADNQQPAINRMYDKNIGNLHQLHAIKNKSARKSSTLKDKTQEKYSDKIHINSTLLKKLLNHNKATTDSVFSHAKYQQARSSVTSDYKEVRRISRPNTKVYYANIQQDQPGKAPSKLSVSSESHSKIQDDLYSEIDLAKSAALNQEISEDKGVTTKSTVSMTRMVAIIATTVGALFGLSMLVAIFQCCCRKKKNDDGSKSSDSDKLNEEKKQSTEGTLKDEETERLVQEEVNDKDTSDQREKRESSEESDDVTVRNRVRKFEVTKDSSGKPRDASPHVRKRPESEAFKLFENKRILIGMTVPPVNMGNKCSSASSTKLITSKGPVPKLQVPKEEDEGKGEEGAKAAVELPRDKSPAEKPKSQPKKNQRLTPENPDVVIASDDEDEDFDAIKRDQSILKSFTRAPPPKNRNRSSQALGLRRKQRSTDKLFSDKSEDEGELTPILSPKQPENKPKSEENKTTELTNETKTKETIPDTEVKEEETEVLNKECPVISAPPSGDNKSTEEQNSPLLDDTDKELDISGNIFLHVDPTAKRSSPSVTPPPKSPKEQKRISVSPIASPKPIKAENLMKDLTEKLKQQSSDETEDDKDDS